MERLILDIYSRKLAEKYMWNWSINQPETLEWKSFEHLRTLYLWICYFAPEKLCCQEKYVDVNSNQNKKKRERKIVWFNPTFSKNLQTNLGKVFFKLLKCQFPKRQEMPSIFNLKLSCSCCRNIVSKISFNNRRIINLPPTN